MKIMALILKILSGASIFFALLAFGSDFLPVEGINLGGHESSDVTYQFYKIVPTEGVAPAKVGVVLIFIAIVFFGLSKLINKYISK